jgi:hypothetical protein
MKKGILLVICLLLLSPLSISESSEDWVVDGYKWSKMPRMWKFGYIEGWLESGRVVMQLPSEFFEYFIRKDHYQKYENIGGNLVFNRIIHHFLKLRGFELYFLTADQTVDMIDKIYSDPRTEQWEIRGVMPLARGMLKEGWTEKDLNEVIAYCVKFREWERRWGDSLSLGESDMKKKIKEFDSLRKKVPKVLKSRETYEFE